MAERNVIIGYVHPGTVTEGFARSLAETCLAPDTPVAGIIAASSPRQPVARNEVIGQFLARPTGDWLMWIDTDMTFRPGAINTLLRIADRNNVKQVAGAAFIYKKMSNIVDVNAFKWDPEIDKFSHMGNYDRDKTFEVDATGSAFVLIHRDVFEWFRDEYGPVWHQNWEQHPKTGGQLGHDMAFFLRTTVEGPFRLLYTSQVTTGHVKYFEVTEEAYFASGPQRELARQELEARREANKEERGV